jgi:hypothetical protein
MTGAPRSISASSSAPAGGASTACFPPPGTASPDALWWPPGKIAGRYLTPFLATGGATGAPLRDPAPAETPAAQGLDLVLLVAEQDAAAGDPASPVQALDDAEAWLSPLPPHAAARRDEWRRLIPIERRSTP